MPRQRGGELFDAFRSGRTSPVSRDVERELQSRPDPTSAAETKQRLARRAGQRAVEEARASRPLRREIVRILRDELPIDDARATLRLLAAEKQLPPPREEGAVGLDAGPMLASHFSKAELEAVVRRLGGQPPTISPKTPTKKKRPRAR
jgi:hypothetical protein